MKHVAAWLLCLMMVFAAFGASSESAERTEDEQAAISTLSRQMMNSATTLIQWGEDVKNLYPLLDGRQRLFQNSFPEKFDLRDYGVVTPVKAQHPWGTCWSFGTVAASEISILSGMGLTAAEYANQYGEALDLSEKHLAYFTGTALPDNAEGKYPFYPGQSGEGAHILEGATSGVYDMGGNYFLSTSSLAAGIGILKEKVAPYQDSEGNLDKTGDWSLPEELRFGESFELKNANVLPVPAGRDAEGQYVYHPEGTDAIKRALISGHGVGISYAADQSRPEPAPLPDDEKKAKIAAAFAAAGSFPDEDQELFTKAALDSSILETLTRKELERLVELTFLLNGLSEIPYDMDRPE